MADYRVSLTRAASTTTGNSKDIEKVVWDITPEFSEGRSVQYKNIDPVHAPGAMYMYAQTGARTFSINGKFAARSINEATRNLAYTQYLRTWSMPVFGLVGSNPAPGEGILGAPPAILFLTAYSNKNPGAQAVQSTVPTSDKTGFVPAIGNNIYNIPVIITNLDIQYPSDVDYIPTINQIPVPTVANVSISLVEAHSPNAYAKFSLQDFKTGNLVNF
jgi:hypothetical protein